MMVTNPTITTLTVTWNPADGNVQGYKVIYVPEDGGMEIVVGNSAFFFSPSSSSSRPQLLIVVIREKPALWIDGDWLKGGGLVVQSDKLLQVCESETKENCHCVVDD